MKILFFLLMSFFQSLYAAGSSLSMDQLKQREALLLEQWHQQQPQVGQVLHRLRKRQSCYRLPPSLLQNLKDLIHQTLAMRSLDVLFKKEHDQVIKLCNDIAQVRQHLKMLNDLP